MVLVMVGVGGSGGGYRGCLSDDIINKSLQVGTTC